MHTTSNEIQERHKPKKRRFFGLLAAASLFHSTHLAYDHPNDSLQSYSSGASHKLPLTPKQKRARAAAKRGKKARRKMRKHA